MTTLQLLVQQICLTSIISEGKNNKINFEKLLGLQLVFKTHNIALIHFNLLQVYSPVPSFVFALLFIPSFVV